MVKKMQITNYTVNEHGLNEIKEFLAANHKAGCDHFDRSMLEAWAEAAEFQLHQGNPAIIEIKSWDSIHGRTQDYTISDAGLDAQTADWAYDWIKSEIEADTTDERISELVAEFEAKANSFGVTLDGDLEDFMRECRKELRDH